ncbi:MAG TPA: retropepsin-like aspartic protease, partial [Planctomycetaceae bacterium]
MSRKRGFCFVGSFCVILLLCCNGLRADERLAPAAGEVLDEFSITNDALVLPVTLNEKTYSFMVDTGASYSIFDTTLLDQLGRPVRQQRMVTAGRPITVSEYRMPALRLGRVQPPPDTRAFCSNLLEPRQAFDGPLDGIIGMDFLLPHIVQLDFDADKIRFLNSLPPEPGDSFSIGIGREQQRNIPYFNLKLMEDDSAFVIDTGFNGSLSVNERSFDDLDNAGRIGNRSMFRLSTAGGTHNQLSGRLDSLSIGRFAHRDLIVDRHARQNHVGIAYLKRFLVTFDFPQKVMY